MFRLRSPGSDSQLGSNTEAEYKHLISFFERAVKISATAITLLIGLAAVLFYRSLSEANTSAENAINRTRDEAKLQISQIKDDAAVIARTEAQKRVTEAFTTSNVNAMIDEAVRTKAGEAIDKQIQARLNRSLLSVQSQMIATGEISSDAARARLGIRQGLDDLQKQERESPYLQVKAYAGETLKAITDDYDSFAAKIAKQGGADALPMLATGEIGAIVPDPKTIPDIVNIVRHEPDLNRVAIAFVALRQRSKTNFRMFDFEAVEQWCKDNKQC